NHSPGLRQDCRATCRGPNLLQRSSQTFAATRRAGRPLPPPGLLFRVRLSQRIRLMSFLPFVQRHLRTELPVIAPQVAALVAPESFLHSRRYLGSSVVFFNRQGEPTITYKVVADRSLNLFLENAIQCAHEAQQHGFSTQVIHATGQLHGRAYALYSWLPGTPL